MTPLLYRLGQFCARRSLLVLGVWVVIAVAVVVVAKSVGQETNDDLTLPGTDSQAATDLLSDVKRATSDWGSYGQQAIWQLFL